MAQCDTVTMSHTSIEKHHSYKLKFVRNVCLPCGTLAEQVTVQGFILIYLHCQHIR